MPTSTLRGRALGASLLATGIAAALLAAPSPATAAAVAVLGDSTPPRLEYDDRGPAVERLQRLLGVRPVSGWFGPITRAAVKDFERRHDLKVNGIVGPSTWRVILRWDAARDASRSGSRDDGRRACPARNTRFSDTYGAARSSHSHAGVDMMGSKGTPIRAVESGRVVRAHWSGSSGGYTITLQGRSGSKFFYAHNKVNLVRAGERVKVGEVIARMGSTGNAGSLNQLHFEYWKSGRESDPVNPTPLVRRQCR